MSRMLRRWLSPRPVQVAIVLLVAIGIWELATRAFNISPTLLPPPSRIAVKLAGSLGWLTQHALITLAETLIGFAVAVVLGIALAIAIVHSRFLEQTLYTLLVALNSIPKVALAPLLIVWFGTGFEPKIFIAAIISLFVIVISTTLGLRSVEPDALDLARSMGATKLQILVWIRFPNALPSIFSAMKVAVSLALIGALVGEFVAADRGLGYVIVTAQGVFDTSGMFAAITLLTLLALGLFYAIDLIERLVLPWHISVRRRATGVVPIP
jgi:NitT/TauT family transport system permease protein